MDTPTRPMLRGDYGSARMQVRENLTQNRSDRRYLLDRMRLAILTMADGYPHSSQVVLEELYDRLRAQGINRDRTVASVFTHEGVRIWKGEPFEQALAMSYYGMQQASLGNWDNARAASNNSLFRLRDFSGEGEDPDQINTRQIARQSLIYERAREAGKTKAEAREEADYLDHGYVTRESNFTLGYLLNGIANQQMDRAEEASDHLTRVTEIRPELEPLVQAFRAGDYNTVLVVGWGLGPRKEGYGPDNALGRFVPRTPSDRAQLFVRLEGHEGRRYRQVLDVNDMARSHMWRNLEDIRRAKSVVGRGLMVGGAVSTHYGVRRGNEAATLAGLGALAGGALLRAGSHVDTRHCDVLAQRYYVVPLKLAPDEARTIELQVDNQPASRLRLAGLDGPSGDTAQLRYVRLVSDRGASRAPAWASRGAVRYGNAHTGAVEANPLPWILGGRDVRPPSERVLERYRSGGWLRDDTLAELADLYRAEDVAFTLEEQGGYAGRHLLEGGKSLVAPLPGTAGFSRLFSGDWGSYEPASRELRQAREAVGADQRGW
jgi:hypothetical protein